MTVIGTFFLQLKVQKYVINGIFNLSFDAVIDFPCKDLGKFMKDERI